MVIVGAGGHAQVVADILQLAASSGQRVEPIGYVDDNPALAGAEFLGLPVLGGAQALEHANFDTLVIAIGSNATRRKLYERYAARGYRFTTAIHPSAVIARSARIGAGSVICAGAILGPGSCVGVNSIINTGSTADHHNQIGDHAHIAPGVHLGGDVIIEEGVFIGIGATVMPQRRVGRWSTVGAGGLVLRDLPAHVTAVGLPARIIREEDGE